MTGMELLLGAAGLVAAYVIGGVRVLKQYERGVVFTLGRYRATLGPGIAFIPPLISVMRRVSTRVVTIDIAPQDVITRDNISVKVNAVLYFRVNDPMLAVIEIQDYVFATSQLAQTTLLSVLGQVELDELLADRAKVNGLLQQIIDERTDMWGIGVSAVEIKDVQLPDGMRRAIARQAEAERERRAKVISAQGELQASETLAQAAKMLSSQPASLQLRYLQTVTEIAAENNSTTLFPIPMDLFKPFLQRAGEVMPAAGEQPVLPAASTAPSLAAALAEGLPQVRVDQTGLEKK